MCVKVKAEIDRDKPLNSTVAASCPDCGDAQAIHAHFIEVTGEKEDQSQPSG